MRSTNLAKEIKRAEIAKHIAEYVAMRAIAYIASDHPPAQPMRLSANVGGRARNASSGKRG